MDYLDKQRDPTTQLYYKGWNQIEEECVELTKEDGFELLTEGGDDICLEGVADEISTSYNSSFNSISRCFINTSIICIFRITKIMVI